MTNFSITSMPNTQKNVEYKEDFQVGVQSIFYRKKFPPMGVANEKDFVLNASQTQSISEITPRLTPYCIDDNFSNVFFVETPQHIDLSTPPFLFRTQYENAQHLYKFSCPDLHKLVQKISKPEKPIFVCGIGRCGTTLLHHALNIQNRLVSYSEPDVLTQIVRHRLHNSDFNAVLLIQDCLRAFANSNPETRLAFKTRSFVTHILDDMYTAFSDAKFIFLYRDAESWVNSNLRLLTRYPIPKFALRYLLKRLYLPYFPSLHALNISQLSLVEILTYIWKIYIECYQGFDNIGVPILPIHYDDLIASPQTTLASIFTYCDLPTEDIHKSLQVFKHDSQHGSSLAQSRLQRSSNLTISEKIQIQMILKSDANFNNKAFRLIHSEDTP